MTAIKYPLTHEFMRLYAIFSSTPASTPKHSVDPDDFTPYEYVQKEAYNIRNVIIEICEAYLNDTHMFRWFCKKKRERANSLMWLFIRLERDRLVDFLTYWDEAAAHEFLSVS